MYAGLWASSFSSTMTRNTKPDHVKPVLMFVTIVVMAVWFALNVAILTASWTYQLAISDGTVNGLAGSILKLIVFPVSFVDSAIYFWCSFSILAFVGGMFCFVFSSPLLPIALFVLFEIGEPSFPISFFSVSGMSQTPLALVFVPR